MLSSAWGLRRAALMLSALGGVAWQLGWPELPSTRTALTALVAALALGGWAWRRRSLLAACLALATIGAATTSLRAEWRLAHQLQPSLEGVDLVVTGVIASLPARAADAQRFDFEVESATTADGRRVALPRRLALTWFRAAQEDPLGLGPDNALAAGQRWRIGVRLKRVHGLANPHGFDFELWLFERGIGAAGSVRATRERPAELLEAHAARPVERARQHVRDAIVAQLGDTSAAGVLAALAVGDQSAIARDDWQRFRDTGVAHLMSISGLHVTMFAWLAAAAANALWRCSSRLLLACPAPLAARWLGLAAATAYALLAGWGVPAQRTLWMLGAAALLTSLGLRWPWWLTLSAAALVVVAVDPWALLQPGFWLSFVAVGLLLGTGQGTASRDGLSWWRRLQQAVRGGVRTQAIATLGLAPLTLLLFQQVSLVGFVANVVAIPLVTLAVTPLALLGTLWPALWSAGATLVDALAALLGVLAALPHAVWHAAVAPGWAQALALAGGLVVVAPLPWRLRGCGALMLCPLLLHAPTRPAAGEFELVALDVGQGSAVLVRTHSRLLVYDAGPRWGETDAGQRVLVPLLRARGESRVDLLMLSHGDSDHVGGAASLRAALPVRQVIGAAAGATSCVAGQRWAWDGVAFELLHPRADDLARPGAKPNAVSCVLRVTDAQGRRALLAGDIEAPQEAALLGRGADLQADMLLVPHHGSRTSSSEAFVAAVAPRWAVVQAGYRNRWGHPVPEVQGRYAAIGSTFVRSDTCGAWTWRAGEASCERARAPRYWRHGGSAASAIVRP
jgi:competence protein ComEC